MDRNGTPIKVGDRVKQINAYSIEHGAYRCNIGLRGDVLRVGRTRVTVQFDNRTKVVRWTNSSDPKADYIHGRYLEVLPCEDQGYPRKYTITFTVEVTEEGPDATSRAAVEDGIISSFVGPWPGQGITVECPSSSTSS